MRYLFILSFFLLFSKLVNAQTYPSLNINMLSHINPETDTTGADGRKYSGCWGWYQASKNKEYALVGTSSGTYFVDVTNPSFPVVSDYVAGRHAGCTWREIKNYQNYCYIVSDDAPPNSFQIVDMQYLPDSVHVVYDGASTYFERCHTIFVDGNKLYCGSPTPQGGNTTSMRVYSLANPAAPTFIAQLDQFYPSIQWVHDMFVRNDTIYASCGNQGFYVFKLLPNGSITGLTQYSGYPQGGYNHSSWQTDDRKTMVFTDEVPAGLCAKTIDVTNLNNITLVDTMRSHYGATAHNPYIMGNTWCWISSYQDGLYLYDISTPSHVTIHGYFDTQPQHGTNDNFSTNSYRGNWGAYPYLPSKIIIALDMQNGVFILDADNTYKSTVGVDELPGKSSMMNIQPNPASDKLTVIVANQQNSKLNYTISDVSGQIVQTGSMSEQNVLIKESIDISRLPDGCYFITVKGSGFSETKKVVVQH
ncbi:MAG: choice-of-anchor B family protein [Bacteroidetes bacterium]|nr:choice-of-anchor B family protein [Bacteroidota bacterium]